MPKPKDTNPLKDEEVKDALKASGFPLEIRLLDAFSCEGLAVEIGARQWTGEKEASREIDLVTWLFDDPEPTSPPMLLIRSLVEAKSLEPWASFVGFEWTRPSNEALQELRSQFTGRPSFGVSDELEGDEDLRDALASAMDPLNEPTVCFQWTVARRTDKGPSTGKGHEDHDWNAFDSIVRASAWAMESITAIRYEKAEEWILEHIVPVLVVGTPHLYVYDAIKDALRPVDELVLLRDYETKTEVRTARRLVNIVTEAAVPKLVARQRKAMERLHEVVNTNRDRIVELAAAHEAKVRER
jgi:hypothetical protein